MYRRKSVGRTKNGVLKNSSINWIFFGRILIQKHLKLSITENRQVKTKYMSRNSIKFQFMKGISVSNPIKSLGYIKCCSYSSPRPIKNPSNSIRYNCQEICSRSRRSETILAMRKIATFL